MPKQKVSFFIKFQDRYGKKFASAMRIGANNDLLSFFKMFEKDIAKGGVKVLNIMYCDTLKQAQQLANESNKEYEEKGELSEIKKGK